MVFGVAQHVDAEGHQGDEKGTHVPDEREGRAQIPSLAHDLDLVGTDGGKEALEAGCPAVELQDLKEDGPGSKLEDTTKQVCCDFCQHDTKVRST